MENIAGWVLFIAWIASWVASSKYISKKTKSRVISIGGGFIIGCLSLIVVMLPLIAWEKYEATQAGFYHLDEYRKAKILGIDSYSGFVEYEGKQRAEKIDQIVLSERKARASERKAKESVRKSIEVSQRKVGTMRVSRRQYGESWPLTVEDGLIACYQYRDVVFITGNRTYGLNGKAMGNKSYSEIWEIRRDHPDFAGGKMPISDTDLIEKGLSLCPK